MSRITAFPWYGGKSSKLSWLLPLIPYNKKYIEPFGGSAAVLLNRDTSSFEVYNDIDGNVTNFFIQLRENRDELITKLLLTHHNRKEFEMAINYTGDDKIELARMFYVKIYQGFMSKPNPKSVGSWRRTRKEVCRNMNQMVSRWLSGIEGLINVYERFKQVSIENRDGIGVVEFYDDDYTVMYCDPPYLESTRKSKNVYSYEMTKKEHIRLSEVLRECKGMIALSGYDSELYRELYQESGWNVHYQKKHKLAGFDKSERQEVLWTNY